MIIKDSWDLDKLLYELRIEISTLYKSMLKGHKIIDQFDSIQRLETYFNILNVVKKELDKKQDA